MTTNNPKGIPLVDVGRDAHGRFRPGNKGGPGNPFARKAAALRKALLDAVNEQDLKNMIEVLKRQALQGDVASAKLVFQYCVGKPAPANDPDRMDADEWQRLQQMRVGLKHFWESMETVPASLACHLAATAWPCELQEGPLAETMQYIFSRLQAAAQSAAEAAAHSQPAPDGARHDAAPARPAAANQKEPSNAPAKPTGSDDRRDQAARPRRDGHSPAQPPSSNGGNGGAQQKAPEQGQRTCQPSRSSRQAKREPPRG